MFKNATILGISPKFKFDTQRPKNLPFHPVTDLQLESSGWAPVRDGALTSGVGRHALMYFMQEKKHIPASAVETLVADKIAELEKAQGFAPGKKARKELKERVIDELLPRALATRRRTAVWLDLDKHRLVIDSTSSPVIDAVNRALIRCFEDIGIQDVSWPGPRVVTEWLIETPRDFDIDDEVELRYPGEHGKTVKFKAANLGGVDVQVHVQKGGASVEAIAMTYDSRISFVMTSNMQLRRIKALDVITSAETAKDVDRFYSEFTLIALELGNLIDVLIEEA